MDNGEAKWTVLCIVLLVSGIVIGVALLGIALFSYRHSRRRMLVTSPAQEENGDRSVHEEHNLPEINSEK